MKLEDFFEKYGEDEQMMSQILAASKDENTLLEFLSSQGIEVTSSGKSELRDEELSQVSGGSAFEVKICIYQCVKTYGVSHQKECEEKCKKECG